jgi:hypothetical protein
MSYAKLSLLVLAAIGLASAASAQYTVVPPLSGDVNSGIPIQINMLQDPGFEQAHWGNYWSTGGSYHETSDGDKFYGNIGNITSSAHTGNNAFDMGASGGTFEPVALEVLRQDLMFPFTTDKLVRAAVWARSSFQTLYVDIFYSDNTVTHGSKHIEAANAAPQNNGWQHWNFTSIIKPNKTIVAIDFMSDSFEGTESVEIDDAELTIQGYLP